MPRFTMRRDGTPRHSVLVDLSLTKEEYAKLQELARYHNASREVLMLHDWLSDMFAKQVTLMEEAKEVERLQVAPEEDQP